MGKFSSLLSAVGLGPPSGGGLKQAVQPGIAPLKKRGDKEVTDAAKRAKAAALLRRGRKSTILTGGGGLTDKLGSVSRPEATQA